MKNTLLLARPSCLLVAFCATVPLLGTTTAGAQNLVVNGSFESNGGNASTTGPGWTFSGNVNYKNNEGTSDGSFAAGYNGSDTSNTGVIFQTLANTGAGANYTVSFDFGTFASNGLQQLRVEVRDGTDFTAGPLLMNSGSATINPTSGGAIADNSTSLLVTDDSGAFGGGPGQFNSVAFTFTALSGSTTLVFRDTGGVTDATDLILDNVSVTAAAVPEPSTWAMIGSGVLTLLAAQRARRRH